LHLAALAGPSAVWAEISAYDRLHPHPVGRRRLCYSILGYIVLACIIYSTITALGMFLLGRPLVRRIEEKAAGEAQLRYERKVCLACLRPGRAIR
jgi:hypothetical protein